MSRRKCPEGCTCGLHNARYAKTCTNCHGPLRADSKSGICVKTPECRILNSRSSYLRNSNESNARRRQARKVNPRFRISERRYRQENRIPYLLSATKTRAKRKGIPFDLTEETIPPVPTVCPVFGIPLVRGVGTPSRCGPELDRIIPDLGYVAGNVMWLSRKANTMKNDATPAELILFAKWILREFEQLEAA